MAAPDPRTVPTKLDPAWQAKTRALFKQAIEIPTRQQPRRSAADGASCLADQFRPAGFPAADIKIMPYEGAARRQDRGADRPLARADKPTKKPMLVLGHMDVVEAKREDWKYDPFVFREEGGYFYGRGTSAT